MSKEEQKSEEKGKCYKFFEDLMPSKDLDNNFLKQADYPKTVTQVIMDFLKLCFGLGCFSYSLKLATDTYSENPALFDAKMYYVFISLFLMLQGLDSLCDALTSKLKDSDYNILNACLHCCILSLYIPFIGIGYKMT